MDVTMSSPMPSCIYDTYGLIFQDEILINILNKSQIIYQERKITLQLIEIKFFITLNQTIRSKYQIICEDELNEIVELIKKEIQRTKNAHIPFRSVSFLITLIRLISTIHLQCFDDLTSLVSTLQDAPSVPEHISDMVDYWNWLRFIKRTIGLKSIIKHVEAALKLYLKEKPNRVMPIPTSNMLHQIVICETESDTTSANKRKQPSNIRSMVNNPPQPFAFPAPAPAPTTFLQPQHQQIHNRPISDSPVLTQVRKYSKHDEIEYYPPSVDDKGYLEQKDDTVYSSVPVRKPSIHDASITNTIEDITYHYYDPQEDDFQFFATLNECLFSENEDIESKHSEEIDFDFLAEAFDTD